MGNKKRKIGCVPCSRGFHDECEKKKHKAQTLDECPCFNLVSVVQWETEEAATEEPKKPKKGATREGLKDPKSTGRKRAARLYPLLREEPCEWQLKRNCGGGRVPITGCVDGKQTDRHHGPVKNTTRNQSGNVHRICKSCHNHWHELNDLIYDEKDYGLLPHDPEPATPEECAQYQLDFITGAMARNYTLASSVKNGKLKLTD